MLDLVVAGGRVVTPSGAALLDIGVVDGRIVSLATPGADRPDAVRVIDARGKLVLPGGIDPHCHIGVPLPRWETGVGGYVSEPPEAATRAAAFGGVTTVIDFVMPTSRRVEVGGRTIAGAGASLSELAEIRKAAFAGHSHVDFSFHCMLLGGQTGYAIDQIPDLIADGLSTIKVFTVGDSLRVDTGDLRRILAVTARHGGMVSVHAEDHELVDHTRRSLEREGRDDAANLAVVHSTLSEDLAFRKVLRLAERCEAAVYMLHVSAMEGVDLIADARRRNLPVYGETLHNYLEFTCDHYARPAGTLAHTYPSLKSEADRRALNEALVDGVLSTTATDHIATSREVKLHGTTVSTVCGGHNGVETRLPVTFTRFVAERKMSLERFAEISATNAARILGLYPQKGAILPGSDADLVLWDPDKDVTIALDGLHGGADYSIWEGFRCTGYPVTTILRGQVIVEDGQLVGTAGDGRWVRQKLGADVLARPVV